MAAIQLKNKVQKVFGATNSYTHYDDSKKTDTGEQLAQDDPAN